MVNFRLPLLVSSRAGYQNLCRLITKMKLRAKKGEGAVYAKKNSKNMPQGLICLTGGAEGPLAAALQQGGLDEARRQVDQLIGIFGHDNVYVELQRHFQREEESRNRAAIDIARSLESSSARHQRRLLRHSAKPANSATPSPPSAITARCPLPDACLPATPSAF